MSRNIRLRSGEVLPLSIVDYDKGRPNARKRTLRSVCYAPFLSMDFDATGGIRLCNHSHTAVAQMSEDLSVVDVWRGEGYQFYRSEMHAYVLDETNCKHCVRQAATGSGEHVFATEQFDRFANDEKNPPYPKKLIFRLNNTCNLACIMCDGQTSSRIRKERDKLPIAPSMYGERFFKDMEEILPHVEHVEFYGGEPFLVKEHIRIFEILERVNTKCTIYVNSNTVSLHPKAKRFLETLNFKTYAVSMDAVDPELHAEIRVGLKSDLFFSNFEYLLELRAKRGLDVLLNVTEHRKNWFELPEVFRFAEEKQVYLHINTCIHPHNVTLYTLPSDQLRYILAFFEEERAILLSEYPRLRNLSRYDFLMTMVRTELESRSSDWKPVITNVNAASDGLLGAPRPGVRPFHSPDRVAAEADRIASMLDQESAARMLQDMAARIPTGSGADAWRSAAGRIEHLLAGLMAGVMVNR
jgi:sulfatase maturation enzyme AslB (radical SAM superfamily)